MQQRLTSALAVLAMLLTILSLCGCTGAPEGTRGETADSLTVTDALGREVTVQKKPERVAALIGSFADVWVLSGGSLCAAAEDAFEDFGIEQGSAVNLGGAHSPSLEALISSRPELVLASASTASNVDMLEPLSAMGITVLYFDVDSFYDYLDMLAVCTSITGRADLYEKHGTAVLAEVERIKAAAEGRAQTVLLLRASATSVKAKGSRGTVLGEMLADLGCINIADNDKNLLDSLSAESIIRQDPCCVFVVSMGGNTAAAEETVAQLLAPGTPLGGISAVRCGRVYVMDKALFNLKPNERWAEAYGILYEALFEE